MHRIDPEFAKMIPLSSPKLKFVIADVVLLVAVGYPIFNSVATTAEYYLPVGELQRADVRGRPPLVGVSLKT
ncbi:MAG: hypothetical protein ACYDAG_11175 [Chloroflexota bacterium]